MNTIVIIIFKNINIIVIESIIIIIIMKNIIIIHANTLKGRKGT